MPLPDKDTLERMRNAIMLNQEGLGDDFNDVLNEIGVTDEDEQGVAKDFLEDLRLLDRHFDAGDAAACVHLGCRKEARQSLEDAGISRKAAQALIALGRSLLGPDEEPHPPVSAEDWNKEIERDDEEEEEDEGDDEDEGGEEDEESDPDALCECEHKYSDHKSDGGRCKECARGGCVEFFVEPDPDASCKCGEKYSEHDQGGECNAMSCGNDPRCQEFEEDENEFRR